MPKDYALRKLHSKEEKVIFCGCDAISGLLIHYLLDELFGRDEYKILHRYDLQQDWEWTTREHSKLWRMHRLIMCESTSFVSINT